MNETMNAILKRRSVRKYTAEMPKREDLEQIIEAGLYAASGKGGQSSIIVAITDKGLRASTPSTARRRCCWCWRRRTPPSPWPTAASPWAT